MKVSNNIDEVSFSLFNSFFNIGQFYGQFDVELHFFNMEKASADIQTSF